MRRYLTFKLWALIGVGLALALPQSVEARSSQSCNRSDSTELVNFYMATNGAKWITSRPAWDFKKPVATWGGVSLRNSRVTAISLNNSNLTGKLPALKLPELEKLELGLNALSGPVPSFAGCPKLTVLYLASNKLECDYQSINFEATPHLVKLDLSLNRLYGNFKEPAIYKLKELNLASNQLSGSLPSLRTIGGSLEVLNLSNNRLTGFFPVMAAANVLQTLNVSHNQLQGTLPRLNEMFKNISVLDLSHNKFSGYIPDFQGFSKLSQLLLGHNEFTAISNLNMLCPKLSVMDLSYNKFSGAIPVFTSLPNLQVLDLTYNNFNFDNAEKIPTGFAGLKFVPQNPISISTMGNQLFVNAGNNTQNYIFSWQEGQQQDRKFITNAASPNLITFSPGFFSCQIRHKTRTELKLQTEVIYFKPVETDVVAEKSVEKSGESVVRGMPNRAEYKRGSSMPIRVQRAGKYSVTVYNDKQIEEWKEPHNVSDSNIVTLRLKMATPGYYRIKVVGPNSFKQFIDISVK